MRYKRYMSWLPCSFRLHCENSFITLLLQYFINTASFAAPQILRTVSKDAELEFRKVATLTMAVRRSKHST